VTTAEKELRRVLVVEDDPDTLRIAALALERLGGFTVAYARTAAEVEERLTEFRPDLLLLDLVLPDGEGLDVVERLREVPERARIPVVVLTARTEPEKLRARTQGSIDEIITKPFDPLTLSARLRRVWEARGERDGAGPVASS
jgi:DNA-binding response OmpR family regulator